MFFLFAIVITVRFIANLQSFLILPTEIAAFLPV